MKPEIIERALKNKKFVDSYLAVVDRCLGSYGVRCAKELIETVSSSGGKLPERPGREDTLDKAVADPLGEEFISAMKHFSLISASPTECELQCMADFVDCSEVCDFLPKLSDRIICRLSCALTLAACLANCD